MPGKTDLSRMNCSLARALGAVGDWWTLLIVRDAMFGVKRFSDFQQSLGIARNILSARLERLVATQAHLLEVAAALVRPGGTLVHVVCSLLDAEGRDQVATFLAAHPGWTAERPRIGFGRPHGLGLRLTPAHDGTDGFFVARLVAPC